MYRTLGLLSLVWLLLSLGAVPAGAVPPQPGGPTQLAAAIVGKPAVSARYITWLEPAGAALRLVVYDSRTTQRAVELDVPATSRALAMDRSTLVWVEPAGPAAERIVGYDLAAARRWVILERSELGALALQGGTLVYQDASAGRPGLYARDLGSGAERLVSPRGQQPVVAGDVVVWSEAADAEPYAPAAWSLHLAPLAGGTERVIARSAGPFGGYAADGAGVVWGGGPLDRRVYRYQLADGATLPISAGAGSSPALVGADVAWVAAQGAVGAAPRWTVQRSSSAGELVSSAAPLGLWGATAERLVVSVDGAAERRLFLVAAAAQGVALAAPPTQTAQGVCAAPPCGQVRVAGTDLVDDGGRWPVHGVQFFLPQYGINSWTFHDGRYAAAGADIDRWLDIARDELAARTLRIFVELPAGGAAPTSHATVYDFARRAERRGMRLGIVVQNSSDFAMTAERRAWLSGLAAYFAQRDATHLIAYVSAANEINNWCSRSDCFDGSAAYVDGAVEWVAQVAATLHGTGILITVGISTEVADSDGVPAWFDFHRRDSRGRRLADLVDFVAPHNYGGGAYGIIDDLRYQLGYAGPVVLEEYGFPTDPRAADPRYTEGARACRDAPLSPECVATAPYFVELSLRAMRETTYAGGAAWMLADVAAKRCGTDPPDLWTGLFAAGSGYCGGTLTTAPAAPKATAHRILLHHQSWPPPPPPSHRVYLPLFGS